MRQDRQHVLRDRHRFVDVSMQNLRRRAGEGRAPDQAAVEERAQRVEIGAPVKLMAVGALFGRHVGRRADRAAHAGQFGRIERARDAEVAEQRTHGAPQCLHAHSRLHAHGNCGIGLNRLQEHVARLDITVDDSLGVGVGERTGNRRQDRRGVAGGKAIARFDDLVQPRPIDERHDQVGDAAVRLVPFVEDRHDVWMP